MGLVDAFSAEDRVEVKFSDFFNIIKQAAQKENIMNGVNCNVPHEYIREMVSGKQEEPQEVEALEATFEIETDEYMVITEAVRRLLKEWNDEKDVLEIAGHITGIVDELAEARILEIRKEENGVKIPLLAEQGEAKENALQGSGEGE